MDDELKKDPESRGYYQDLEDGRRLYVIPMTFGKWRLAVSAVKDLYVFTDVW